MIVLFIALVIMTPLNSVLSDEWRWFGALVAVAILAALVGCTAVMLVRSRRSRP